MPLTLRVRCALDSTNVACSLSFMPHRPLSAETLAPAGDCFASQTGPSSIGARSTPDSSDDSRYVFSSYRRNS